MIDYVLEKLSEQGVPNARKVRNPVQVAVVVILVIIAVGIVIAQFLAQPAAR